MEIPFGNGNLFVSLFAAASGTFNSVTSSSRRRVNKQLYSIPRRGIFYSTLAALRFDSFVTLSAKSVSTFM